MTTGLIILLSAIFFVPLGVFLHKNHIAPTLDQLNRSMDTLLKELDSEKKESDIMAAQMMQLEANRKRLDHKKETLVSYSYQVISVDFWRSMPKDRRESWVTYCTDALFRRAGARVIEEGGFIDVSSDFRTGNVKLELMVPHLPNYFEELQNEKTTKGVFRKDCLNASKVAGLINSQFGQD